MAFELSTHLAKKAQVSLLKWGGSNTMLPLVLPYFVLWTTALVLKKKTDVVYLQDGVLAPIGWWLKKLSSRTKVVVTLHGLDITYNNFIYQHVNIPCIRRLDSIVVVSHATKDQAVLKGIDPGKISVIQNGITDKFYSSLPKADLRRKLADKIGFDVSTRKVILNHGRLVERKGIHWFIEYVLPKVLAHHPDAVFLISGVGEFYDKIEACIARFNYEAVVKLLGKIDYDTLVLLLNSADIFVMPNIRIPGDIEGFGIAQLEAASVGLPVVSADLEGIRDAISSGKNGILIAPGNAEMFSDVINELLSNPAHCAKLGMASRTFTLENFSWDDIAEKYLSVMKQTLPELSPI